MRSLTTLGALARREAVLTSFLGAAAAVAALAVPLGAPWLLAAGAIIAALGAVVRVTIVVPRVRIEGEIEKAKLDGRTRVPIAAITGIDPTKIGVDAAAQTILPGEKVPAYLPRDADKQLRAAIHAALDGDEPWIVVVVGPSKVGKSRALFEALLDYAEEAELDLVAPKDGEALRSLLTPGARPRIEHERCVLWLDDLEPFLNQDVTFETLREWHEGAHGRMVAGTFGGKGSDQVSDSASGKLTRIADDVLQNARQIGVGTTTAGELDPLRSKLDEDVLKSIEQHGLAAYLVAAPLLERKLLTGRHAAGEPECPEGVAVVYAAIDWARCGRTDSIAEETLHELWLSYLPAGTRPQDDGFKAGLDWTLRFVAGKIALLGHAAGGYRAYDYIVRFANERPGAQPPHHAAWATAISSVSDAQALAVGMSAFLHDSYDDAVTAFEIASRSSANEVAAIASVNLGATLGALGRSEEALAVYEEVVARYGDAPEPALREQVANVLFYKGATLAGLGHSEEALAVYEEVVARYGDAPEPALREQVAKALVNKGIALDEPGRRDEALAVYEEVVARYGDAPEPALRELVAMALFGKGAGIGELGRSEEALAVYEEVVARYGDAPEPALREQVARALLNKGIALAGLGRQKKALAVYEEVVARFGDAPEPALRGQAAWALLFKCIVLSKLGHRKEEVAVCEEIIARFGDAPELRSQVANALFYKGSALARLGRQKEEVAVYEEVLARFGDAPEPALRELVADARRALADLRGLAG